MEGVGGEENEERSEHPEDEQRGEVGAAGLRNPGDEGDGEDEGQDEGRDVGGGEDSEDDGEKNDAGPPLVFWALEGVRHSDGGVDGGEEAECGPYFIIRSSG